MYNPIELRDFYADKNVLITGATGFKGSWLSYILYLWGANVTGVSLEPEDETNLYNILKIHNKINSLIADIRDYESLKQIIDDTKPEIIIHLAAQPLVRLSYEIPKYTYEVNVMGTVNLLEAIRNTNCVKSFLNVTTDKVYLNKDEDKAYRENDPLDGYDPYSNSKSCSEIVTHAYRNSFLHKVAISTARAGNVIGGGDFAKDRIIPDCFRALQNNQHIIVRNKSSIRPYEHVLEPLMVYLTILKDQYNDKEYSGYYNIGPDDESIITTGELVDLFCKKSTKKIKWIDKADNGPHEAKLLKLNNSLIKEKFGYKPKLNIEEAMQFTVEWYESYINNLDMEEITKNQIERFINHE